MTRILGIDPGSIATGYGIIDMQGNHARHLAHGVIRVRGEDIGERLRCIFDGIGAVAARFGAQELAVERVFVHRNADSALKLGQARGAAISAGAVRALPVFEYSANQVKQATVGKGHAAKQQVQHMMKVLLRLDAAPPADAADALAVAICHAHFRSGLQRIPGATGMRRGRLR
jgi:crossover junction endodeoxyribonuclease RuvC